MHKRVLALLLIMAALAARSEIVSKPVEYKQGDTVLEGLVRLRRRHPRQAPRRAGRPPVEGLGRLREEAGRDAGPAWLQRVRGWTSTAKASGPRPRRLPGLKRASSRTTAPCCGPRVRAGLDVLASHELTDPKRIAAIGYCFGGTTVLELARSGADIAGVVSFHGGLSSPTPGDAKNIKAKVLALHGADDPYVPPTEVAAFEDEMRQGGVDWQLVAYGGAVHAFTDWSAGQRQLQGSRLQRTGRPAVMGGHEAVLCRTIQVSTRAHHRASRRSSFREQALR